MRPKSEPQKLLSLRVLGGPRAGAIAVPRVFLPKNPPLVGRARRPIFRPLFLHLRRSALQGLAGGGGGGGGGGAFA